MFLGMAETLEKIAEFVNKCLGPLGSEGFNWGTMRDFIVQIIATIILFIIVRIFLWKPITQLIEAKRNAIDKELVEAKEANEKVRVLTIELEDKLKDAQIEVKELLDTAEKDANLRRDQIIKDAKAEAKKRLDNVEVEIQQEIVKKNNEIKQTIVDVAFTAARKIVGNDVDEEKYLKIVNEIIEGESK
ncbi:MAG: F0F1 ATP synthase subunit B [Anaeroplasmataceae bacterium]